MSKKTGPAGDEPGIRRIMRSFLSKEGFGARADHRPGGGAAFEPCLGRAAPPGPARFMGAAFARRAAAREGFG